MVDGDEVDCNGGGVDVCWFGDCSVDFGGIGFAVFDVALGSVLFNDGIGGGTVSICVLCETVVKLAVHGSKKVGGTRHLGSSKVLLRLRESIVVDIISMNRVRSSSENRHEKQFTEPHPKGEGAAATPRFHLSSQNLQPHLPPRNHTPSILRPNRRHASKRIHRTLPKTTRQTLRPRRARPQTRRPRNPPCLRKSPEPARAQG